MRIFLQRKCNSSTCSKQENMAPYAPRSPFYSLSLFHSAVAVLFCVAKQIKECKGWDTYQIFSALRIVNAKIIGSFSHHDRGRSLTAQLHNCRIIRNRSTLTILDFNEDVLGIGVFHHNIDFLPQLRACKQRSPQLYPSLPGHSAWNHPSKPHCV